MGYHSNQPPSDDSLDYCLLDRIVYQRFDGAPRFGIAGLMLFFSTVSLPLRHRL
ncbi:hypothetical protein BO79DRAFT_71651 [Aspergillus costaricaensis CBS 115574]|uniref:Uncharacterized protein n=1 Tax=Aspergillus costaricaensis CBS 115574 TaxID=1448317 RepID=A0ACD1INN1_9EURO|nr:hypothetical protein BO79DRAFT_71651 [Aspergillus costaricaensis CBS 115574]RAK92084.1 hypothetical protein BO79DRAFT_71651 [Aspergillus costaricaensis CBS 115574]